MKSESKPALVFITNLYPLPWEPNRATFNLQQFSQIEEDYQVSFLIPVAFPEWFAHRKEIRQTDAIRLVPYFYIPKIGRRFYSVFMFFSLLLHSGFWLLKRKPKILFASWAFPEAVATSWLSRLFKTRFLFKVHGSDINMHGQIPARANQIAKAAKHAEAIVSVSEALKQQLIALGVEANKINVIYNGVDHSKFGQSTDSPPIHDYLLYVGNLKHDKGVIELLEGFAGIASLYPELQLVYAGNGVMKSKIELIAKEIGLASRVTLLGTVNHQALPSWISHARFLVLPSYNEGVPNVLLEAMACGTPVLATRVGGIPEVVSDYAGELIPARDAQAVTDALETMYTRVWDREQIKAYSGRFTWQKNKQQLLALLDGKSKTIN